MAEARTRLHNAVLAGNLENVKPYIGGANAQDREGRTALMLVSKSASNGAAVVNYLLQFDADKYIVDKHGDNALHYAVKERHKEIVNSLLARGMDVNSRDGDGNTPLIAAAQKGYTDIVKILTDHRADIHMRTRKNRNALYFALWNKHDDMAKYLLGVYCGDDETWPELELACHENNTRVIRLLLQHELNLKGPDLKMCFMNARSLNKQEESFKEYITYYDFDVFVQMGKKFKKTMEAGLLVSSEKGYTEQVRLLLDCGVDIDTADMSEETALHRATINDNECDVDASTSDGETALMMGCRKGRIEIVQLLITRNADVNKNNALGQTALHVAVLGDEKTIAAYLLNNGSGVNA
ncbi:putative ankyrin repeat protein RF_0381, partial [Gigantopelta aegis]|uniref:putative ankyrin repeat protein RF_0381 n=1 Tax=Gigantopelta aegis TaxID=1735272 RepID=UPI001B8886E5